jgi:hypothetical protein
MRAGRAREWSAERRVWAQIRRSGYVGRLVKDLKNKIAWVGLGGVLDIVHSQAGQLRAPDARLCPVL